MNEADVRQMVFRAAREAGFWPVTQTDASRCGKCGNLLRPPVGRPDILLLNPRGPGAVIEVKTLRPSETSFPFSRIEDSQRRWLSLWQNDGGESYIALGIIQQHGQRQMLDHLYLVPWERWLTLEKAIEPIQSSVPLEAGKGMKRELQEGKLDLVHLLSDLEMERENGAYEWRPAPPPGTSRGATIHQRPSRSASRSLSSSVERS